MLILVVDDIDVNRDILCRMLEANNYSVIEAANGLEAIEAVKNNDIDLILMDIMMPEMNGKEATTRIKKITGDDYLPVIFITALSEDDAMVEALAAGGDDFISKPYKFDLVNSKIKSHTRIRELHNQLLEKNKELQSFNNSLAREQELIEYFFENAIQHSYFDPNIIQYHMSSRSAFNGDLLLSARRPAGGQFVLLGDFTGHGLAAAMGTLPVAQIFFSLVKDNAGAGDIVKQINHQLQILLPVDMFFCATLVEINTKGDKIVIWAGGLPDAFIISSDDDEPPVSIKSMHMPLGILEDEEFDQSMQLFNVKAGSRLFLYTDGLSEITNISGEMFGDNKLSEIVENKPNNIEDVLAALSEFCDEEARQHDDISLIQITCQKTSKDEIKNESRESSSELKIAPVKIKTTLSAQHMRDLNPVDLVTNMITCSPMLAELKSIIHIVLSELYSNALEHSILGLDGSDKSDEENFIKYYQTRDRAMLSLENAEITIGLEYIPGVGNNGNLRINIQDNGRGFDGNKTKEVSDQPNGRGMLIVQSICEDVVYSDGGRAVEVIYRLPG